MCGRPVMLSRMDHAVCTDEMILQVACHGQLRTIHIDYRVVLGGDWSLPAEVYDPFPLPRLPAMLEGPKPPKKRGRALPEAPLDRLTVYLMPLALAGPNERTTR